VLLLNAYVAVHAMGVVTASSASLRGWPARTASVSKRFDEDMGEVPVLAHRTFGCASVL
jgi:hypothetical protein